MGKAPDEQAGDQKLNARLAPVKTEDNHGTCRRSARCPTRQVLFTGIKDSRFSVGCPVLIVHSLLEEILGLWESIKRAANRRCTQQAPRMTAVIELETASMYASATVVPTRLS